MTQPAWGALTQRHAPMYLNSQRCRA